jgi:hypothetical protein
MITQPSIGDTVFVKDSEMTGRTQTLPKDARYKIPLPCWDKGPLLQLFQLRCSRKIVYEKTFQKLI